MSANEYVTVRADDLKTLLDLAEVIQATEDEELLIRLRTQLAEAPANVVSDPGTRELPPGVYGRIELPGYRENQGWITEELRFGLPMAVVRNRDGVETAAIAIGPMSRVVFLPPPDADVAPVAALPPGTAPAWYDGNTGEDPF